MSARDTSIEQATATDALRAVAHSALPAWLPGQRWFGAKGRALADVVVADVVTLDAGPPALALAFVDAAFAGGGVERYAVPAAVTVGAVTQGTLGDAPAGLDGAAVAVDDATDAPTLVRALLALALSESRWASAEGALLEGRAVGAGPAVSPNPLRQHVRRLAGEQSNTNYAIGDRLLLKLFRKLQPGVQPDAEVLEYLSRAGFANVPRMRAAVEYLPRDRGPATTVALVLDFVASRGDAWTVTLESLGRALADGGDVGASAAPMRRLGEVTGALHLALASGADDAADFAPEAFGPGDRAALADAVAARVRAVAGLVATAGQGWTADAVRDAARFAADVAGVERAVRTAVAGLPAGLRKQRIHGDYHLGQVLVTPDDYVVIDFEGEPMRPLSERRAKALALRDVAGMLRSFDYAAQTAVQGTESDGGRLRARAWEHAAREAFLAGYLTQARAHGRGIVPDDDAALARGLALFELDKALYEVTYEVNHRPDWVAIPLAGIARARAQLAPDAA